jgi:hypothetical protein
MINKIQRFLFAIPWRTVTIHEQIKLKDYYHAQFFNFESSKSSISKNDIFFLSLITQNLSNMTLLKISEEISWSIFANEYCMARFCSLNFNCRKQISGNPRWVLCKRWPKFALFCLIWYYYFCFCLHFPFFWLNPFFVWLEYVPVSWYMFT